MATTLYVAPSHHLTAGRVITDATIVGWQSDPPALYITDHSGESDRLLRILLPDGEPIPLLTGAAPSHPSIAATAETIFIAGLVDERVLLQVTDLEGAPLAALFISDKAPPPYKDNLHPWLRSVEPLGPNRVVFITSHRHGHVNLIWLWELAGPHPR